ncbi:MAG: endonuclease/exonuclease/phosphatase family protein [Cytophagales bacterium]|nr:endonuclease/exonuclease/phosphatase family protein [Cytophaga sp.]
MDHKRTYKIAIVLTVVSLALFFMPDIVPRDFWYSAFLILFIPIIILVQFILFVYWSFRRKILFLLPLFLLLINWKYIKRTVTFSSENSSQTEFSVMSYNVRVFNVYPQYADKYFASSRKIIDVIKKSEADVICLQEFYNDSKDTLFNTVKRISKKYPYYYYNDTYTNHTGATFGMAIFSKYPIVAKDRVIFNERSNNQILYADIKMPQSTVRVYNMHLQSMNINDEEIVDSQFDKEYKNKMMQALLKYKNGTISRSKQVDKLVKHVHSSPYKVLVCGDLNDPPYSYTYEQLSEILNNAFEEKGSGFGFSFNGKLPFLRIDHQFCDPNLGVTFFETQSTISYTDHFPIKAGYRFK